MCIDLCYFYIYCMFIFIFIVMFICRFYFLFLFSFHLYFIVFSFAFQLCYFYFYCYVCVYIFYVLFLFYVVLLFGVIGSVFLSYLYVYFHLLCYVSYESVFLDRSRKTLAIPADCISQLAPGRPEGKRFFGPLMFFRPVQGLAGLLLDSTVWASQTGPDRSKKTLAFFDLIAQLAK